MSFVSFTSPHTVQVRVETPASVQVAAFVSVHSPNLWPSAGISFVSFASPHTVQVRVETPGSVQVAAFVSVHSPNLWPNAGTVRVSSAPQTVQVRVETPASVQVAALVTVHSPNTCLMHTSVMSYRKFWLPVRRIYAARA